MTNLSRILPVLTLVIAVAMMAGCGGQSDADIDATVEAKVGVALAEIPTVTPIPTPTHTPPTHTPWIWHTPEPTLLHQWGVITREGMNYMSDQQYLLAIEELNKTILLAPHDELVIENRFWRGEAYLKMDQYSQAVEDFDKVIGSFPSYWTDGNKAHAYMNRGQSMRDLAAIGEL